MADPLGQVLCHSVKRAGAHRERNHVNAPISQQPDEWRRLTDNAIPLMQFLFEALGSRIDVTTAQGKTQIAEILFQKD